MDLNRVPLGQWKAARSIVILKSRWPMQSRGFKSFQVSVIFGIAANVAMVVIQPFKIFENSFWKSIFM